MTSGRGKAHESVESGVYRKVGGQWEEFFEIWDEWAGLGGFFRGGLGLVGMSGGCMA
jgi:hypothetical protein